MATKHDEPWLAEFRACWVADRRDDALALLESRSSKHAGTPKAADKSAAANAIRSTIDAPAKLLGLCATLAAAKSPTRRELACVLLRDCYEADRERVLELALALSDDEHWETRLWAGDLVSNLLGRHFDQLYPVLQRWAVHESQFVRVAVATSVRDVAHKKHPERCGPLLDLIEPLVGDDAHEVQRNLGGYAVGGALLGMCPDETLTRVRKWARADDEATRWNTAMVFSAAPARKHVDSGLELLSDLARDGRKHVWQAVSTALRNLAKGDPERVAPVLRSWLKDERKLPAALALRSIERA
ncbi:MAG: DNA alkylation repair protein [Dehalococcoidia bacterium]